MGRCGVIIQVDGFRHGAVLLGAVGVLNLNITNWKTDCQYAIVSRSRRAKIMRSDNFHKIFYRIRKGVLAISQLPSPIPGTTFYKPKVW
jgi:hypothetical protein